MEIPPPFMVSYSITTKCNLKCKHCYSESVDQAAPDELSTEEAFRLMDDLSNWRIGLLIIDGGKPLCREDMLDVVKYASSKGIRTTIGSNGTLIDETLARTSDGRSFRILAILDEYTRECLAILVKRRIRSQDVIDQLFHLFVFRSIPEHIRSDNGPEFTSKEIRNWLNRLGVKTLFIESGSPWENGYIESFNGKLRDELLKASTYDRKSANCFSAIKDCHLPRVVSSKC